MANAFFLSGLAANACVQAQGVTVTSEDADFPKANLQNGFPWKPFRFGDLTTNQTIEFDCNVVVNPSFETDADGTSPPTGWTIPTGGGTPDVSTAQASEGTKSLRLNAASEAAYQDVLVVPGNTYRLSASLYGDGTDPVNAYLYDPLSGKWLNSGQSWVTTKTAWATKTPTGFTNSAINFVVEPAEDGHVGAGRLRIQFERPGSITGAAYVDSVYFYPKITVAAIAYHTLPFAWTLLVQSDDEPTFTSPAAHGTLPANRFRTYLKFAGPSPDPHRYWRFSFEGTPVDGYRPWIGQPILGERKVMTDLPLHSTAGTLEISRMMPIAGTEDIPNAIADAYRFALTATWRNTATGLAQAMNEMLAGCYYGVEPLLICPKDDVQRFVYGRGKSLSQVSEVDLGNGRFEYSVRLTDDQYPLRPTE